MRWLKIPLLAILVPAFFFLIGEGAVRVFAPQYGSLYHSRTLTGRHPLRLNQSGYRDHERTIDRQTGHLRIVAIGDSITWGYSVKRDDIWTLRLERFWNQNKKPPLEVWNLSGRGRTVGIYLGNKILEFIKKLRPDLVFIQINMNDVGNSYSLRRGDAIFKIGHANMPVKYSLQDAILNLRLKARRSYFSSWLDVNMTFLFYRMGIIRMDPASPRHIEEMLAFGAAGPMEKAWKYLTDDLKRFQLELQAVGARTAIVPFPYRYNLRGDPHDNPWMVDKRAFQIDPFQRLEQIARENRFLWVDLRSAFQMSRDDMRKGKIPFNPLFGPLEYNHPNAAGHLVAAKAVFQNLITSGFGKKTKNQP